MATVSGTRRSARKARSGKKSPAVARGEVVAAEKPAGMSLEAWQRELRRQFGREQQFAWREVGERTDLLRVRSHQSESKNTYRVAIRGTESGDNFCSCPDFATRRWERASISSSCLASWRQRAAARRHFKAGFRPRLQRNLSCNTARGAKCDFGPAKIAPPIGAAGGPIFRRRTAAAARCVRPISKRSSPRPAKSITNCAAMKTCCRFVAEVRDGERRREVLAKAFPQRDSQPGVQESAESSALRLPARRSPVRGQCRSRV